MARFLEHVVTSLATLALFGAILWFGGPRIMAYVEGRVLSGIEASAKAKAEASALSADTVAANTTQKSCTAEIAASMKAGAAIAKAAQPQPVVVGQAVKLVGADDVNQVLQ